MTDRKSKTSPKEVAGNVEKYYSYCEAWTRIRLAQENGFYLEAIAIQESIMSDCIMSYLCHKQDVGLLSNKNSFLSFSKLIIKWRSEFPNGLLSGSYSNLIDTVDEWRLSRNKVIHAIVKSKPGEQTQSIDLFLEQSKEAAKVGEAITREVCNWSKKNIRK